MYFTISITTAILALTSRIIASPVTSRQEANTTLLDFQVTNVGVFTPSGRPESYPWAYIQANVTDPNQYKWTSKQNGNDVIVPAGSQEINCEAKWYTSASPAEDPLGRSWPCDPVDDGYWLMTVLPGPSSSFSSEDFVLKFTHVVQTLVQGMEYTATSAAQGAFAVGDNLAGTCGGSGVCGWHLIAGKMPVEIEAGYV